MEENQGVSRCHERNRAVRVFAKEDSNGHIENRLNLVLVLRLILAHGFKSVIVASLEADLKSGREPSS